MPALDQLFLTGVPRHTRVLKGGTRAAANSQFNEHLASLTATGAAQNQNNPVRVP